MRKFFRPAIVALGSAAAVGLTTSPAGAVVSAAGGNCGYGQTCAAYAQSVPRVGTGSDVVVNCSAATPYTVQITVVQCYIRGNNGDVHWTSPQFTQGQASTLTATFGAWDLRSNVYQVCTGAGVVTTGGTYYGPTGFVCGAVV